MRYDVGKTDKPVILLGNQVKSALELFAVQFFVGYIGNVAVPYYAFIGLALRLRNAVHPFYALAGDIEPALMIPSCKRVERRDDGAIKSRKIIMMDFFEYRFRVF